MQACWKQIEGVGYVVVQGNSSQFNTGFCQLLAFVYKLYNQVFIFQTNARTQYKILSCLLELALLKYS